MTTTVPLTSSAQAVPDPLVQAAFADGEARYADLLERLRQA